MKFVGQLFSDILNGLYFVNQLSIRLWELIACSPKSINNFVDNLYRTFSVVIIIMNWRCGNLCGKKYFPMFSNEMSCTKYLHMLIHDFLQARNVN